MATNFPETERSSETSVTMDHQHGCGNLKSRKVGVNILHEEFLHKWRSIIKPLITDEDVNDSFVTAIAIATNTTTTTTTTTTNTTAATTNIAATTTTTTITTTTIAITTTTSSTTVATTKIVLVF